MVMKTLTDDLLRDTLVAYHGGGWDGCIFEWNYAYFDSEGEFHDLYSSGRMGCRTLDDLASVLDSRTTEYYDFSQESERYRFADREGIKMVLRVAYGFQDLCITIEPKCECCDQRFDALEAHGVNAHCVGGMEMDYGALVCPNCWDTKYCVDCEVMLHGDGTCPYCGAEEES